jgi:hypothetical protein
VLSFDWEERDKESYKFISDASFNSFIMEEEAMRGSNGFTIRKNQRDDSIWLASQPCVVDHSHKTLTITSMFPLFVDVKPPDLLQRAGQLLLGYPHVIVLFCTEDNYLTWSLHDSEGKCCRDEIFEYEIKTDKQHVSLVRKLPIIAQGRYTVTLNLCERVLSTTLCQQSFQIEVQ